MSFTAGLMLLVLVAMIAGGILGVIIFGKYTDGTIYFWTDDKDSKVYTQIQFNETDINTIKKQKHIILDCVVIPPIKDDTMD